MMRMNASRLVAALLALACAAPAWASYTSIAHNLQDGNPDTSYSGGVLTISDSTTLLDLNDPTNLGLVVDNVSVSLTTYFQSFNPAAQSGFPYGSALFTGGNFSLTFDVPSGSEAGSYSIGGPIYAMLLGVTSPGASFSIMEGSGLFTAVSPVLPGSNNWPDGGGFSSIDTISLHLNLDLTGYDFSPTSEITGGETLYTLQPNDSGAPEPASLLLLGLGGLALLRRRMR